MEFTTLEAKTRDTGKRALNAIRKEGQVPCTLYGHHVDAKSFQVPSVDLQKLFRSAETNLVKIDLGGESWECILKDIDFHPVYDHPIHADFQVLQAGEKITLVVPFHFEGVPAGQIDGGNTQFVLSEVEISCLPKDIPPSLNVEVASLNIGDSIHLGDLEFDGIEFSGSSSQTVVIVHAPRVVAVDEEEGEEVDGEAVEGEEGAEEGESGEE